MNYLWTSVIIRSVEYLTYHNVLKIIQTSSSSSSTSASPVKYSTALGTILSRIKWPISKSAASNASVSASSSSSSCKERYRITRDLKSYIIPRHKLG